MPEDHPLLFPVMRYSQLAEPRKGENASMWPQSEQQEQCFLQTSLRRGGWGDLPVPQQLVCGCQPKASVTEKAKRHSPNRLNVRVTLGSGLGLFWCVCVDTPWGLTNWGLRSEGWWQQ